MTDDVELISGNSSRASRSKAFEFAVTQAAVESVRFSKESDVELCLGNPTRNATNMGAGQT